MWEWSWHELFAGLLLEVLKDTLWPPDLVRQVMRATWYTCSSFWWSQGLQMSFLFVCDEQNVILLFPFPQPQTRCIPLPLYPSGLLGAFHLPGHFKKQCIVNSLPKMRSNTYRALFLLPWMSVVFFILCTLLLPWWKCQMYLQQSYACDGHKAQETHPLLFGARQESKHISITPSVFLIFPLLMGCKSFLLTLILHWTPTWWASIMYTFHNCVILAVPWMAC